MPEMKKLSVQRYSAAARTAAATTRAGNYILIWVSMKKNISDPNSARCIDYVNNRNLDVAAEASAKQYSGIPAAVTRALP